MQNELIDNMSLQLSGDINVINVFVAICAYISCWDMDSYSCCLLQMCV